MHIECPICGWLLSYVQNLILQWKLFDAHRSLCDWKVTTCYCKCNELYVIYNKESQIFYILLCNEMQSCCEICPCRRGWLALLVVREAEKEHNEYHIMSKYMGGGLPCNGIWLNNMKG